MIAADRLGENLSAALVSSGTEDLTSIVAVALP
jgi:hypothetical protein